MKMSQKFKKTIQIKFHQADPAGILFFGNVLMLAHECFEDLVQVAGIPWKEWFGGKNFIAPIRHTETNYMAPFPAGESFEIEASVVSFGDSSMKMRYLFKKLDKVHAEVLMVHAFLSMPAKEKMTIPENLRAALKPYVETT